MNAAVVLASWLVLGTVQAWILIPLAEKQGVDMGGPDSPFWRGVALLILVVMAPGIAILAALGCVAWVLGKMSPATGRGPFDVPPPTVVPYGDDEPTDYDG